MQHPEPTAVRLALTLAALAGLAATAWAQDRPRPVRVAGRAVDENGAPIAGAGIALAPNERRTTELALRDPLVRTGDDGRFEFDLPLHGGMRALATPTVVIAAPGRLGVSVPPTWSLAERMQGVDRFVLGDVPLPPGAPLRGVVRGADGRPLAGARVVASDVLQPLVSVPYAPQTDLVHESIVATDAQGRFEVLAAADSGARLRITADGHLRFERPHVRVGEPIVAELQRGGHATGMVLDATGRPAAAMLWVQYEVGPGEPETITTADGMFRIPLQYAHRYRIRGRLDDGTQELSSPLQDGPAGGIEVRRTEGPGQSDEQPSETAGPELPKLVVRTVDEETGRAIEKVRAVVFWFPAEAEIEDAMLAVLLRDRGVPSRQPGEIRLAGPGPDESTVGIVCVGAEGHAPAFVREVQWDAERPPVVEVKLAREAVLAGTVVRADDGKPVVGAQLLFASDEQARGMSGAAGARATTDGNGAFRIGGLGAGKHRLIASLPGGPRAKLDVELERGQIREGLRLELPRGATIAGRLLGSPPSPLISVALAHGADGWEWWRPAEHLVGGARRLPLDGGLAFAANELERGDYELLLSIAHRAGRGGWLQVPLDLVRLRTQDVRREWDLAELQPGTLRGTFASTGAPVEAGRFAVVSSKAEAGMSDFGWGNPFRSGFGSEPVLAEPLAADGSFALPATRGTWALQVVDLRTGVVVAWQDGLEVEDGVASAVELRAELVPVRVRLAPAEQGGAIVASRLVVNVQRDEAQGFLSVDEMEQASPGVSLADGRTEIDLLLPARPVQLHVVSNAAALFAEHAHGHSAPLGQVEFTPGKDLAQPVTIEVAAPPQPQ